MVTNYADIKLLLLDVDGVLTDGSIFIDDLGNETKRFNVKDGMAINAWRKSGREIGIITARSGKALSHRMKELGVTRIIQGAGKKIDHYKNILTELNLTDANVAYMGDDLPDLAIMQRVGYPIAPSNACDEIIDTAQFVTVAKGGKGAVRQAIEHLLKSANAWDDVVNCYQED